MKPTASNRALPVNQTLKVMGLKEGSSWRHPYPVPCLGLVPSPGQERVTMGTEGFKLRFGLLNASATHFDTSGHAALSFLQVL